MTISASDVTGVVLCGGAGKRFGGADKPLALLDGVPLVRHVCERLAPQVGRVVISANRNTEAYRQLGFHVVVDAVPDRGPLAGVLAGLDDARTEYVFVCPGDAPLLPRTLVARLGAAIESEQADLAFPDDGDRGQYLFALLRRSLREAVRSYLDSGSRAVHGFVESRCRAIVRGPFEAGCFANVNTREDLAHVSARMDRIRRDTP